MPSGRMAQLQGFEQSYLEARLAIPDSTLTVPNYRVGIFNVCIFCFLKFLKYFGKNSKNRLISFTKMIRALKNGRQIHNP